MKGSEPCSAKGALVWIAEAASKRYVTTGSRPGRKPQLRARVEDLPKDVLQEALWLNTVGTFGGSSARYWSGRAGACL